MSSAHWPFAFSPPVATEFLADAVEVTSRRNMLGYTGHHRGLRVTVMGSGMGIPSCAIYATELAREYGVRRIVRVGTCGGVGDVALGDLLLAQSASTDSNFNRMQFGGHDLAARLLQHRISAIDMESAGLCGLAMREAVLL